MDLHLLGAGLLLLGVGGGFVLAGIGIRKPLRGMLPSFASIV